MISFARALMAVVEWLTLPEHWPRLYSFLVVLVRFCGQPCGQLALKKAPELALTFSKGMGGELALTGPSCDSLNIEAKKVCGSSRGHWAL